MAESVNAAHKLEVFPDGQIRRYRGLLRGYTYQSHYMEEAEMLSDRIGIMKDGRLLALGTAAELMEQSGRERFEDAFVAIVKEARQ